MWISWSKERNIKVISPRIVRLRHSQEFSDSAQFWPSVPEA